ncbi:MAG TPA: hypothetical protein VLI90_05730, partial [Tepidisphaeraceae bacterium]|nr:hypothetical protein [Tepidisphaeraceae bacterium]
MQFLCSGIYLLLITATGALAWTWVNAKRVHLIGAAGFAFAAGSGLLGLLLFDLSLCGVAPSRPELSAIALIVAIGLILRRRALPRLTFPRAMPKRWDGWTWLGAIALLVLIAAVVNVAIADVTFGLSDIDAFGIWMLKAKAAYLAPLRPIPAVMTHPSFSYSHQDYPLGFPMVIAGFYAMVGGVDEQLAKTALLPPIYASLIAVMYTSLRWLLPARRAPAICITAIFAAAPVLTTHAGMAVAELSLVLMHACCLALLMRWMIEPDRRLLIASAVFAALAAMEKNEGLALLPIVALVPFGFAVSRRVRRYSDDPDSAAGRAEESRSSRIPFDKLRAGCSEPGVLWDWIIAWLTAGALIAPWLIYRCYLPRTHEDYGSKLTSITTLLHDLPRLGHVLPRYLRLFVAFSSAGAIWILLLIVAICCHKTFRRAVVRAMWILLLLHAGLYMLTFVVTPWDVDVLLPMVGPKLLMHIAPTAVLLIGLHLSNSCEDG